MVSPRPRPPPAHALPPSQQPQQRSPRHPPAHTPRSTSGSSSPTPADRLPTPSSPPKGPPTPRFRSLPLGSSASQSARLRRSLGPAALSERPLDFDPLTGPLAGIFATIGAFTDLGVPDGTLAKDNTAWRRWEEFCNQTAPPTNPWRCDRAAHSGADPAGFDRETRLLCAFLIWVYDIIQPRSKTDKSPKPESAYAMVSAIRRIHKRYNIDMVSCSQLGAVLKGLTTAFILEHGAEALLPSRREPLGPDLLRLIIGGHSATRSGQALASHVIDWDAPFFISLAAMFAVAGSTGFRKAEVALPSATTFDDRRLSRASLLWRIDGTLHADPSAELLRSLVADRDFAVIKPPRSKADQDGTKFGALPIYLPYVPADTANAASWLQRLELRLPCHGQHRRLRPLFAEGPHSLSPMSHGTVDRFLGLLLRSVLPEAEAKKYSFHSFRVGFACALLAAGCPPATIQALARWRSVESLAIYARLNPSDYGDWVSKALLQRTDSTTTRRLPALPILDNFDLIQSFATSDSIFTRVRTRDTDPASAPTVPDTPTPRRPRRSPSLPTRHRH